VCFLCLGSYWIAKVINVDDENKNIEIQYFDDNALRIENSCIEMVERASILCIHLKEFIIAVINATCHIFYKQN